MQDNDKNNDDGNRFKVCILMIYSHYFFLNISAVFKIRKKRLYLRKLI